ncbi:fatty acyl-AMP ligase [Bauldia sp.]|uniref:fatty acyl-AMP ligase n=1 Tax=Bauldia sp. TaxID=2575872 RepID=UPI003BACBAB0
MNAPPRNESFNRVRSVAASVERHARERPHDVAFRLRGRHASQTREIDWRTLDDRARRIAGALEEHGVAGQPVAIICPSPLDFVASLCGCLYAGAVVVPVPAVATRRAAERIRSTIETARPQAILAPADVLAQPWIAELLNPDVRGVALEAALDHVPIGNRRPIEASDDALMQFTSGSTGTPRGVVLTQANLAANCAAIVETYGLSAATRGFSWLPLHHDMGLVGHILTPLWIGCRSTLMDPLLFLQSPLRWLRLATEERATITSAPNFAFALCVRAAETESLDDIDLSSVTAAVCGGESVWPEIMTRFCDIFARADFDPAAFAPSYGLAEATLLVSSGRRQGGPRVFNGPVVEAVGNDESEVATVDLGAPVRGVSIRIVDQAGQPCGERVLGEIEISGPCVGRLVSADADSNRTDAVMTGDLGFVADGALHITGRRKELIILRGQNVYPADIESAAERADPAIHAGAVAAVATPSGGTEEMLVVFEAESGALESEGFAAICRNVNQGVTRATGYTPGIVAAVRRGALPRTTSGKIKRRLVARLFRDGELRPLAIKGASAGLEAEPS